MGNQHFEIHLRGAVPPEAIEGFDYLSTRVVPAETILTGDLPDQAALYGVLNRVQALGLELIEVRRAPADSDRDQDAGPRTEPDATP